MMSTGLPKAYIKLSHKRSPESFLDQLDLPLNFKSLPPVAESRRFYDTFEWHAFQKNRAVVATGKRICIIDLNTGNEIACVDGYELPQHFLAGQFDQEILGSLLGECSRLRAFSSTCRVDCRTEEIRVVDPNEKTMGSLFLESFSLIGGKGHKRQLGTYISCRALRGYHHEMGELLEKLESKELFRTKLEFRELYLLFMKESGRQPGDYSSKISLSLDPHADMHESARTLLRFTLSVMKRNENGIMEDIDTEFLHDYRVAIRRTRSLLSLIKNVFLPEEQVKYRELFRELGKRTNHLRDLDVYLLKSDTYHQLLPPLLSEALTPFFHELEAERRHEQKTFALFLQSDSYHEIMAGWSRLLDRSGLPDPQQAPGASRSTLKTAIKSIGKAWKRVIANGSENMEHMTAGELHCLRIDCKKLRYLLEFFTSVLPPEAAIPAIKQLKALQDHLGLVVDLHVQRQYLTNRLASRSPSNSEPPNLSAALGGLITSLYRQEKESRSSVCKAFTLFNNEETRSLFSELLKPRH